MLSVIDVAGGLGIALKRVLGSFLGAFSKGVHPVLHGSRKTAGG